MHVAQAWRYPVKSMQGELVDALDVDRERVHGDREWGVRDSITGDVLTGRATRALLHASAHIDPRQESVCITFPDGRQLRERDDALDLALSSHVGQPVHLAHAKHDEQQVFETESMFEAPGQIVQWQSRPGSFNDGHPIHILTTASLRAARAQHPNGAWDVRRFRPNLLLDVDGDDFVEDGWTHIRVGALDIEIYKRATRCALTARSQPGLLDDLEVPRSLARNRNAKLGVYGRVTTPGSLARGDVVTVA